MTDGNRFPASAMCEPSLAGGNPRGMSRIALSTIALALLGACGDDTSNAPPAPGTPGAPGAPAAGSAAAVNPLVPRVHVEDRVPEPEKNSIRHTFKERDFTVDTNRDPFQSFFVTLPGTPVGPDLTVPQPGAQCTKPDQLVATNYSYTDLRLVGIVAQGTQRKVLMMDSGNLGHIIKRGDCVGKEKAMVKDIGTGYLTFVVMPDAVPNGNQRPPEEHSVQLHPSDLPLSDYSQPQNTSTTVTPVMPPTAPTQPTRPALPMPAPVPTPAGIPVNPTAPAKT